MRPYNEIILFDKTLKKVQSYLKPIGMQIDTNDVYRTRWERFTRRRLFTFNVIWMISDILGQLAWLVQSAYTGKSFVELTNLAPCLALCVLGCVQAIFFMKHMNKASELIKSIQDIQSISALKEMDVDNVAFLKAQIKFFNTAVKSLTMIIILGLAEFGMNPFLHTALHYRKTGEIILSQPFLILYPFDASDIRFFFFCYVHIMWGAILAVLTVLAPCFQCYAFSTFIIYQFHLLKMDIEQIVPYKHTVQRRNDKIKIEFRKIIDRHRTLIQCVYLMEKIYAESTLCNVFTSSLLICLTGFNVMAIKDWTLILPFLLFLILGLGQIFLLCYYGDKIAAYSTKVSDAAYNSQWYNVEPAIVQDLMIIAARAKKPCKLTALRYTDINFKTFTKILSSSWSYFALLWSVYNRE